MKEFYRSDLKAHLSVDESNKVRAIRHSQEYLVSEQSSPLNAAIDYLNQHAGIYETPSTQFSHLSTKAEFLNPGDEGIAYRKLEERAHFDAYTFGFCQTYLNTPVWQAGFKVTVKQGPNRIVHSVNTSHPDIEAKLPPKAKIDRYRELFASTNVLQMRAKAGEKLEEEVHSEGAKFVSNIISLSTSSGEDREQRIQLIRGRFWIYRYDSEARLPPPEITGPDEGIQAPKHRGHAGAREIPDTDPGPTPQIGEVPETIKDGEHYFVAEITFKVISAGHRRTWRALVDVQTDSVLYLRSLSSNVNGLVFEDDPITKTGDVTLNSASSSATLNPHRDDVPLLNLDPPSGSVQALSGEYAQVAEVEGLPVTPPTEPVGTDFDYDVRTHDFAAVSGYFHVDRLFRVIEDLGFAIKSGPDPYFANTNFPVEVDIRCWSGNTINAHCVGDGMGGIDHVGYGLMDTSDTVNPLGRVCDPRVTWHELCGHGILYEYVDSPNFGFSHSAGDGLSGIYFDPGSNCWGVDGTAVGKPGDLRFTYVPWHPSLHRRFDRDVADGWAWGGSHDDRGYQSEEILATTHFNIYRAIGGDSANLGRRIFASRMTIYLILRAVKNLTPATNPMYAREFADELIAVDALNWTSEGVYGGAYNKVIRWAFEKQGEYQTPLIVVGGPGHGSVTTPGDPPDVDVYIDDGRAGEYQYQAVHWNTTTIWNRRAADGMTVHQEPALGATNYAYVKIKNRGTQQANNVVVYGYHTKPGAGLLWPGDFEAFTTPQINVGTLGANNTEEKTVGPFEWTPNINAYGHDCMLMVVSADGDPSNVANFTAGEVVPEWRLVPNDNNVGQRNVFPVPGGGGTEGLMAGLNGFSFFVGNPNPRDADIELQVTLPPLLADGGWRLELDGLQDNRFPLASGAKREVFMTLRPGDDFSRDQVINAADRDISIAVLADDNVIGGMTYRLDPDISRPFNSMDRDSCTCRLLLCLYKNMSNDLRERLIQAGINLDGLIECVCGTEVHPPGSILLDPPSLDFGMDDTEKVFVITNLTSSDMGWRITSRQPNWIMNVDPRGGRIAPGATANVSVQVHRRGLNAGQYQHEMSIRYDDESGNIVTVPFMITMGVPN